MNLSTKANGTFVAIKFNNYTEIWRSGIIFLLPLMVYYREPQTV